MVVYICTKLHENILDGFKVIERVRFTVFFLCTSTNDGLYVYKVSRKYSGRYQSYRADTIFISIILKGHNSVKK